MVAQVGALRVVLGANTAQFEQGMRRAQTTARMTGQNIERSMSQMRVRTVQAFGSVRVAAAGLGLALGAGIFAAQVRSAFEFAASLTEASRAIGVSVEQYQILTRAAMENGASQEGMARAVGILNRTLGQARAGVPAAVQAFRALRIDPEQFTRAGDVIPRVMESIRRLRTESEQAAAAQRLFGRGAMELIPFLVQGAAGYDRATEAARRHGLMTAEQAARADEAKDAIDGLALTIRTNLGIAIAENSGAIRGWIAQFEALGSSVAGVIGWIESLRTNLAIAENTGNTWLNWAAAIVNPGHIWAAQVIAARNNLSNARLRGQAGGVVLGARGRPRPRPAPATTGGADLDLSPSGGRRGGGGRNAAEQAARRRHEVDTELNRAKIDELRSQQELTTNAATRADLNLQISFLEQMQAEMDRTLAVRLKDRTQAEADAVADIETRAFHNRRQAIEAEEQGRIAEEQRDVTAGTLQNEIALASAAADLADTAVERRNAQLHLLDLAQQQERLEQEAILASRDATDAQKQVAQARLDTLDTLYLSRRQAAMDATRGPLADFLAELPLTAERANEALQRVAADGLASITDGLADAILMTRSWGDVFKNVARQIISELLRIQIQRQLIGPLSNALSGLLGSASFAGAGGSFGGAGASSGWAGRASGGPVLPGRTYRVGEKGPELLRMGSQGGFVVPNHALGGPNHVVIELRDEMLDARIVRGSVEVVRAAAPSLTQGAKAATIRELRRPRL